jgi:(1->4)-alpha-D-glucan 1-alpha-D-glucosylmutase
MSRRPAGTYRLQIRAEFGFDDAAARAGYLARLGVTHAYLSPILQAAPGSAHGYDVVDHTRLSDEAGGAEGFARLSTALAAVGLGAIADVVPNHMAVPTPLRLNAPLWAVLRDGPDSPYASWFDIDWTAGGRGGGQVLLPVLGDRIGAVLADGLLKVDRSGGPGGEPVLRYYDHEFPLRPGTEDLPIRELLAAQFYRPAWWRVASEELNYRRFFDVDTLAAIRVEDESVFDATHALLAGLIRDGSLSGLRIDHPDGLADPRGYLRRLATATGDTWVVVEKILEDGEELPTDWPCAGTTGYDALNLAGGLFVDPAGAGPLTAVLAEFTGDDRTLAEVVEESKRLILDRILSTEVNRLVDLLVAIVEADIARHDHPRRALRDALVELLVGMDRYRAYVVPGEPAPDEARATIERALAWARPHLPEPRHATLDLIAALVLDGEGAADDPLRADFVVRFQQACGPVMAKGLEDTTFYRWHRLTSLNEVGADPGHLGVVPEEFHAFAERIARDWPATMTTLSTHDTKRSEDARARLAPLAEIPREWASAVRDWHEICSPPPILDAATEYLFWQTLVATWSPTQDAPIPLERLTGYLAKATREAKLHTSWIDPVPEYDDAVAALAESVLADEALLSRVGAFCRSLEKPFRVAVLGQKLVQLTMPGVADVYQGTEIVDLSLVDPDNRRPVDYARRERLLEQLDAGATPASLPPADRLDAEKLLVTSRALRLRRDRPDLFVGGAYRPLVPTTPYALGFERASGTSRAVTLATRLGVGLERAGGFGEATVDLPEGSWTDVLTGRTVDGGRRRLADLLSDLPVALLAG